MERTNTATTGPQRAVLLADGVFCGLSGVIAMLAARPASDLLGLNGPAILVVFGASLLLYGAWLSWRAVRQRVEDRLVLSIALLNTTWVVGSVLVLVAGLPNCHWRGVGPWVFSPSSSRSSPGRSSTLSG